MATSDSDLIGYIVAVIAPGIAALALVWYREPKIRRRIALQEQGVDPRRVETVLESAAPPATTLHQVESAMTALRIQATKLDQDGLVVSGKKGPTFRSWGQMLVVHVEARTNGGSHLNVKTWPTTARAGTDWGAGNKLMQAFAQELERQTTQALQGA